jgi:hypothetical protein
MTNFIRKNTIAIIVVLVTLTLAGVAIFTAIRLFQLRQQPISPNVPESRPGATDAPSVDTSCAEVAFTLEEESSPTPSATATPTSSASPSGSPTVAPTATPTTPPIGGNPTPTPSSSSSPRPSVTPRPSTAPSSTPVATTPSLPQAGVSAPTIMIGVSGIVLLLGAIILAK